MTQINLTPLSNIVDEVWGKNGTERRDAMETQLKEEVNTYLIGEAIRNARKKQNLTQEELGNKIGVQRSQICKLESGKGNITLGTLCRLFRTLGIDTAWLDLGTAGRIALW